MFYIKADLEIIKGEKLPQGYVKGIEGDWISLVDEKEKSIPFINKNLAEDFLKKINKKKPNKQIIFYITEE